MLMAVKFRTASRLGIIAVPYLDPLQTNRLVQMPQRFMQPRLADDVISCDVRVASIDARGDRNDTIQAGEYFRDLLETAAQ